MQYLISLQNQKLLLQNPPEISAKDFYSETQILRRFHKKNRMSIDQRQDMRCFPQSAEYQRHIPPSEHTLASISPSLVSQAMNLIISRLSGSRIIVCFRLPGFSPVTCQEVPMHSALSSETAISAFPMETNSPITAAGQHGSFTHFPLIARRYASATLMTSV